MSGTSATARRRRRGADAVVAALAAVALLALSACATVSGEDGDTNPAVPATASPEEVVSGYLQALVEHDFEGAAALTIHGYAARDGWPTTPPDIDVVSVGTASPDVLVGEMQREYDDAVTVPARVVLRDEEDMPDGLTDLTFTLWRGRVVDRWLIAGQQYPCFSEGQRSSADAGGGDSPAVGICNL